MRYLMLIYDEEKTWARMSEAEIGAAMAKWGEFHGAIDAAGIVQDSARLRPVATATTVRVKKGDRMTTDGPFAETKEQLGGFYLIDVPNLDAAIDWAKKVPIPEGSVEVRPVWEMDEEQAG